MSGRPRVGLGEDHINESESVAEEGALRPAGSHLDLVKA
jgi:hypothetical protein